MMGTSAMSVQLAALDLLPVLLQIGLAFIVCHLKRDEPLYHLGHAGAFISRLTTGHDKGMA